MDWQGRSCPSRQAIDIDLADAEASEGLPRKRGTLTSAETMPSQYVGAGVCGYVGMWVWEYEPTHQLTHTPYSSQGSDMGGPEDRVTCCMLQ